MNYVDLLLYEIVLLYFEFQYFFPLQMLLRVRLSMSLCFVLGEPARFHSFYIAVCRLPSQTLTPLDIITLGRLGANVKKTVVLCSVDSLTDKLSYMSLQWTGFSWSNGGSRLSFALTNGTMWLVGRGKRTNGKLWNIVTVLSTDWHYWWNAQDRLQVSWCMMGELISDTMS